VCVTGLIGWWAARAAARARVDGWSHESRTAVALAVALAASGALSFNYSRDRLGGMARVPYAGASFFAVRAAIVRLNAVGALSRAGGVVALMLLACAWQSRVLYMLDGARKRAVDNHKEWITDLYQRRTDFTGRPDYLRILEALAVQGTARPAVHPLRYPARVRNVLGPS
jgi:hypothetical protein